MNKKTSLKNVELIELNEAYRKIFYWFFSNPTTEISLNDLTKQVNVSKTTANKVVSNLSKEGFLKLTKLGKLWRIKCNQQHPYNQRKKIAYNLEMVYMSNIIEMILERVPNARSIVLFGSYRKGDDIETSDIDIAVETLDNEQASTTELGKIPEFGYRNDVKVNIFKFTRNKIDLNVFANIANGIVIYGFLEASP